MKNEVRQDEKAGIYPIRSTNANRTGDGATTARILTESKTENDTWQIRVIRAPNRVTGGNSVPEVLYRSHTACTYVGKAEQAHLIPNEFDDGRYPGACG